MHLSTHPIHTHTHIHTHMPSLAAKRKKRKQRKKEAVSKEKPLKDCDQGENVTILAILQRLKFKNFACRTTMVADNTVQCASGPYTLKSISTGPALTNHARKMFLKTSSLNATYHYPYRIILCCE